MTRRFNSSRLRIVLAGMLLALGAALILSISPRGAGTAEAALTAEQKYMRGRAVTDAANNPGLVSDCAILLNAKDVLRGSGNVRALA